MMASSASEPKKLIATGSSGFVGRHFCSLYGGVSLDDQEGVVDLRDVRRVRSAIEFARPEVVVHLAAQSSVAASFDDPAATFSVNLLGTLNLLQALSTIKFQGVFLYVGSADVYGQIRETEIPAREDQLLHPRSPYAVSKVAAEALCYQWSQTHDFRMVLARPFNQIGPGQNIRFAVADFARQIVEIRRGRRPPFLVTGDIDVTRDFTDVRDAVRAYRMLLDGGQNGEIYNICSGQERSLRSIVEELLRIAGIQADLQTDTSRLRPNEQRRVAGDPDKIRSAVGWSPQIPITKTLADILQAAEEN